MKYMGEILAILVIALICTSAKANPYYSGHSGMQSVPPYGHFTPEMLPRPHHGQPHMQLHKPPHGFVATGPHPYVVIRPKHQYYTPKEPYKIPVIRAKPHRPHHTPPHKPHHRKMVHERIKGLEGRIDKVISMLAKQHKTQAKKESTPPHKKGHIIQHAGSHKGNPLEHKIIVTKPMKKTKHELHKKHEQVHNHASGKKFITPDSINTFIHEVKPELCAGNAGDRYELSLGIDEKTNKIGIYEGAEEGGIVAIISCGKKGKKHKSFKKHKRFRQLKKHGIKRHKMAHRIVPPRRFPQPKRIIVQVPTIDPAPRPKPRPHVCWNCPAH